MMVQFLTLENERFKAKVASLEQRHEELVSTNKELTQHLEEKNDKLHKKLGGFQKLSNMHLMQKSILCKLDVRG